MNTTEIADETATMSPDEAIADLRLRVDSIGMMVAEIHSAIVSMDQQMKAMLPGLGNSAIGRMLGIGK